MSLLHKLKVFFGRKTYENSEANSESVGGRPVSVLMATDDYHLKHFGRTEDGMVLWIGSQLNYDSKNQDTTDYTFKFVFDSSGELVSSLIETIGKRNSAKSEVFEEDMSALIDENPIFEPVSEMIKPFKVVHEGIEFGLIVREPETAEDVWAVEFMPGNTMAFFEPFDSGFYDT